MMHVTVGFFQVLRLQEDPITMNLCKIVSWLDQDHRARVGSSTTVRLYATVEKSDEEEQTSSSLFSHGVEAAGKSSREGHTYDYDVIFKKQEGQKCYEPCLESFRRKLTDSFLST